MPRCPLCGRQKTNKVEMLDHVASAHANEIPAEMSTARFLYSKYHDRDHGLCRICHKPTKWNEKTGKPYQLCGSQECKELNTKVAQERLYKVYGKTNLLSDMSQQQKMLSNRKISGKYRWSDGKHEFTYTGSYEKFAIEWLDKVMDLDPDTIEMPGPVLLYELNGETKEWLTDMYLSEFNLVVEIKDGSFDKNTHPGWANNRLLEKAKDASMKKQNVYNYVKVTNKNMLSLANIMAQIRLRNIMSEKDDKDPLVIINESLEGIAIRDDILRSVGIDIDNGTAIKTVNKRFDKEGNYIIIGTIDGEIMLSDVMQSLIDIGFACTLYRSQNMKLVKEVVTEMVYGKIMGVAKIVNNVVSIVLCIRDDNDVYKKVLASNETIDRLCESIYNENVSSVAGASPIMTTGQFTEIAPYQMQNKFDIPELKIIAGLRDDAISKPTKINEEAKITDGVLNGEDDTGTPNTFSSHGTTWSPLTISDGFTSNETIDETEDSAAQISNTNLFSPFEMFG